VRIRREHVADVRRRGEHARARVHGRARQLDRLFDGGRAVVDAGQDVGVQVDHARLSLDV
jgi:hypothetical protein